MPTFFPKASKNKDIWWETNPETQRDESDNDSESRKTEDSWDPSDERDDGNMKTTAYLWDSMVEEDREDTMNILKQ